MFYNSASSAFESWGRNHSHWVTESLKIVKYLVVNCRINCLRFQFLERASFSTLYLKQRNRPLGFPIMASKVTLSQALGTDGSDYNHRQKIATHYQVRWENPKTCNHFLRSIAKFAHFIDEWQVNINLYLNVLFL